MYNEINFDETDEPKLENQVTIMKCLKASLIDFDLIEFKNNQNFAYLMSIKIIGNSILNFNRKSILRSTISNNKGQQSTTLTNNRHRKCLKKEPSYIFSLNLYKKTKKAQQLFNFEYDTEVNNYLSLIFEIPEVPVKDKQLEQTIQQVYALLTIEDYLASLNLVRRLEVNEEKKKEPNTELLAFLYYIEGLIYFRSEKNTYSINAFYRGLKNNEE